MPFHTNFIQLWSTSWKDYGGFWYQRIHVNGHEGGEGYQTQYLGQEGVANVLTLVRCRSKSIRGLIASILMVIRDF